jgi:hypothetical protein
VKGHENVKATLLEYLAAWMPIRLEMIRLDLDVQGPKDPTVYMAADNLPQNDPAMYPCVVVTSTSTVGMTRRQATASGEIAVFDVDYDVTIVVAVENSEYSDDVTVTAERDRLMLAARECVILPARLNDTTWILQTPMPTEDTGAAAQTLRGNPLAAGTINVRIRATETLMPTTVLAALVGADVTVTAVDADENLPE